MQLTIGKLAAAGEVGIETVRYYQRRGLMDTPARSGGDGWGGGVRRYDEDDLRRLKFIRAAQGAGFTLDEIGELLALEAGDDEVLGHQAAAARTLRAGRDANLMPPLGQPQSGEPAHARGLDGGHLFR